MSAVAESRGGDGAATVAFLLATTGLPTPAVVLRLAGAALGAEACPSQGSMAEDTLGDLTLATVLLANAGFVDAVGFLTLSDLFVSFTRGNSTQLAIGIGGVFLSKAPGRRRASTSPTSSPAGCRSPETPSTIT